MSRLMTPDEIADVLWRNPSAYARVTAHKVLVASGQWSQVYTAPGIWEIDMGPLPISPNGYSFTDERFGNVIIFPAANGQLYFNTDVTLEQAAAVQLPPYTSPSGNTPTQILAEVGSLIAGVVSALTWVAAAVLGLMAWKAIRRAY